jgi:hypothetical protein
MNRVQPYFTLRAVWKPPSFRYMFGVRRELSMKLGLIVFGLLATTGVVYAACLFC